MSQLRDALKSGLVTVDELLGSATVGLKQSRLAREAELAQQITIDRQQDGSYLVTYSTKRRGTWSRGVPDRYPAGEFDRLKRELRRHISSLRRKGYWIDLDDNTGEW